MPTPTDLTPGLSIVVPAYNEAGNIIGTLSAITEAARALAVPYEIIVVNDGSSDETDRRVRAFQNQHREVRLITHQSNLGFGAAYRTGLLEARKDHTVMIPGDNAYPAESLRALFSQLGRADIVFTYTSNPEVRPLLRSLISKTYTRIANCLFGLNLKYYNGLCLSPTGHLRELKLSMGFGYATQCLIHFICVLGLSYVEIPVEIVERRTGKSKAFAPKNIASVLTLLGSLTWKVHLKRHIRGRKQKLPSSICVSDAST